MQDNNRNLDYFNDHYCPVYERVIDIDLCYESMMCLNRWFKVSSVSELSEVESIDNARVICSKCPYSEL